MRENVGVQENVGVRENGGVRENNGVCVRGRGALCGHVRQIQTQVRSQIHTLAARHTLESHGRNTLDTPIRATRHTVTMTTSRPFHGSDRKGYGCVRVNFVHILFQ